MRCRWAKPAPPPRWSTRCARSGPALRLLLTHGTATGREAGAALLRDGDAQCWLPWDTPGAVRRFLRHHRPAVGVLMETEIWPNLLHEADAERVPMVLANARLSEKSLAKGERIGALVRPVAATLAAVLAQTEADARRLRSFGAERVQVCGNLKFDLSPDPEAAGARAAVAPAAGPPGGAGGGHARGRGDAACCNAGPRWTRRGRCCCWCRAIRSASTRWPTWRQASASRCSGAATGRALPPAEALGADVWLGDSMGEMPLYYAASDVALLGGSFAPLGGQNLIEAAACGCPVVMGPHTFNFSEAAELSLAAGAALRVADIDEGVARAVALAHDPARNDWVQRAFGFAAAHRGAAERMAREVLAVAAPPLH